MNMAVVSVGELLNRPSSVARQVGNLDHLVISASKQKDGTYIVVSRYGDDRWQLVVELRMPSPHPRRLSLIGCPLASGQIPRPCYTGTFSRGERGLESLQP